MGTTETCYFRGYLRSTTPGNVVQLSSCHMQCSSSLSNVSVVIETGDRPPLILHWPSFYRFLSSVKHVSYHLNLTLSQYIKRQLTSLLCETITFQPSRVIDFEMWMRSDCVVNEASAQRLFMVIKRRIECCNTENMNYTNVSYVIVLGKNPSLFSDGLIIRVMMRDGSSLRSVANCKHMPSNGTCVYYINILIIF